MMRNRSIPECTVIPEVAYPNIGEAVQWLTDAFGFRLRIRMGDHRAQMNVGDGAVVLVTREGLEAARQVTLVRVEELDHHYARASIKGAKLIREPVDYPYGERQYTVEDFAGNRWTFTESIADVWPGDWGGEVGEL
jgi:uncharacterized glyoxalase superfamily protein PhnB